MNLFAFRDKANFYALTKRAGSTGEGGQRHARIILIKRTIHCRTTGVHPFGKRCLADVLQFHGLGNLPGNDPLECSGAGSFSASVRKKRTLSTGAL